MREFVRQAFEVAASTTGSDTCVRTTKFLRPSEVDLLVGDASKAETELGWKREVTFPELVRRMVEHDLAIESRPDRRNADRR